MSKQTNQILAKIPDDIQVYLGGRGGRGIGKYVVVRGDATGKIHPLTREEDEAVRIGIRALPAMSLILEMLLCGVARFEPSTSEFCFNGLRYSVRFGEWNTLLCLIGLDEACAALDQTKGASS